jgi:hypothetical protein
MTDTLKPITVYLPADLIAALEKDAAWNGRSGVSAQVRWILGAREQHSAARATAVEIDELADSDD